MPRSRFNWPLLAGFVLSLATFPSFHFVFVKMPITRDVPWVNLLLLAASVVCLWVGVRRAFAPGPLRAVRAILGSLVTAVSVLALAFFVMAVLISARDVPASTQAPQVGAKVPDLDLLDMTGAHVSLANVLKGQTSAVEVSSADATHAPKGVLLIFYMYSMCSACNSELHDMQASLPALTAAGVLPVAISSDTPDLTRQLRDEAGYTFPFLSDPGASVIRQFDVVNEDGQTARPADFLLDPAGVVRWRMLTSDIYVRARPAQVLAAATLLR